MQDADLPDDKISDVFTLLSYYILCTWKSFVCHCVTATKSIAKKYPLLVKILPEVLQQIYDPNCLPQNFVTIAEILSEIIQHLKIDQSQITLLNDTAENQTFKLTNITDVNTKRSLEASPIEQNQDTK